MSDEEDIPCCAVASKEFVLGGAVFRSEDQDKPIPVFGLCVFCKKPRAIRDLMVIQFREVPNATPVPAYICRKCESGETEFQMLEKGR